MKKEDYAKGYKILTEITEHEAILNAVKSYKDKDVEMDVNFPNNNDDNYSLLHVCSKPLRDKIYQDLIDFLENKLIKLHKEFDEI